MDFKELALIMRYVQKETMLQDLYIMCEDRWDWNIVSASKGTIISWDSDITKTFEEFRKLYKIEALKESYLKIVDIIIGD